MLIVNYMKINKSLLMQLFFNNILKAYLCELWITKLLIHMNSSFRTQ